MTAARRDGIAMIEAIVALVILTIAASAWMALGAQSSATLSQVLERERALRRTSRILSQYAVMTREDLVSRAGRRRHGPNLVRISQVREGLFEVEVVPDDRASRSLRTLIYQPSTDSITNAP